MSVSLLIPEPVVDAVLRKLGRLAARCDVAVKKVDGTTYLPQIDDDGAPRGLVPCARVTVGDMPRSDWEFVARLEHTEAGVIVSCAPGESCPMWFRDDPSRCEHCSTSRRRKDTFVIRHAETGELKQIGRNCLGDFLVSDPSVYIARAELAAFCTPGERDESEWGGGWGRHVEVTVFEYVACVCSAVRRNGFRKSTQDGATKNEAAFLAGEPPRGGDRAAQRAREEWRAGQPNDDDKTLAKAILAWDPGVASDFCANLHVALRCATAPTRRQGLLAAAPGAYARAMGDEVKRKAAAARPDAGYFGAVGERVTFVATLMRLAYVDNQWGGKTICSFATLDGHSLVWFASGTAPGAGDVGKPFNVKATIKKHDQYKGKAQTVLSRAKLTEVQA